MTREEAVSLLRRYKRDVYRTVGRTFFARQSYECSVYVYGRFLIDHLIEKIKSSTSDPVQTVSVVHSCLDWQLGELDDSRQEMIAFARTMEREAWQALLFLKYAEKERNKKGAK